MIKIEDLLLNTSVYEILITLRTQLRENGVNLLNDIVESGTDVMITCPYHKDGQERRPSAGVRISDGMFHCFTCQTVKSLQELISNCFGYDDYGVYGIQWLAKHFATVSIENRTPIDIQFKRNVSRETIKYVSEQELDSYRYYHPYMYERKLTNEVIEIFDVGFDITTNCLTFPVRDITGGCLFIARRSVCTKYFNYPSGVQKPIYGIYEISRLPKRPSSIIVCESILDALYFWTIGKYAVALNGLGSASQYKELNNLPCRKIILCTDMDCAGLNARIRLRQEIKSRIVTEYLLPVGRKDANDCTIDELKNLKEVF